MSNTYQDPQGAGAAASLKPAWACVQGVQRAKPSPPRPPRTPPCTETFLEGSKSRLHTRRASSCAHLEPRRYPRTKLNSGLVCPEKRDNGSLPMMLALRRLAARLPSGPGVAVARPFTTSAPLLKGSQLPPRPKPPPDDEIEEKFIKGSGPGGQKIVLPPVTLLPPEPSLRATQDTTLTSCAEQNQLRGPTEAHPDRHRRQVPGHPLPLREPPHRPQAPRRPPRRARQRRREPRRRRGREEAEETRQEAEQEPQKVQGPREGEGGGREGRRGAR